MSAGSDDNTQGKIITCLIAMAVLAGVTVSRPVGAESLSIPSPQEVAKQSVPCDDPTGSGARFYDFDRIVVYYVNYPNATAEKEKGFPDALKFDNFNARLVEAIKKNFSLCLKMANGEEKPIVVVPSSPDSWEKEPRREYMKARKLAWDERSLTILVLVERRLNDSEALVPNFGRVSVAIHRAGLKGLESLPLIGNRFRTVEMSFDRPDLVDKQFEELWKFVRPIRDGRPEEQLEGVAKHLAPLDGEDE